MLTSIENGIHFVENAARIPSYIPAVSTVTGAARAVSSLTLAVASVACAFFHQVNALHARVTSQMEKKLEHIQQRDLAVNLLGSTIIGVCRGVLEALPIIGNLAAYAIDSYANQKEMAVRINRLSENYLDLQNQLEKNVRDLGTAEERNRVLSGQIQNLQQDNSDLQTIDLRKGQEITRLSRQVETLANQKKQAEDANETLRSAKRNAEDEVRIANLNYSTESQKVQALTQELQKVKVLEQKLNVLASEKQTVEQEKDTLAQEIEELTQEVAHLQEVRARNEETIKAYRIETKKYQDILKKEQAGITNK